MIQLLKGGSLRGASDADVDAWTGDDVPVPLATFDRIKMMHPARKRR